MEDKICIIFNRAIFSHCRESRCFRHLINVEFRNFLPNRVQIFVFGVFAFWWFATATRILSLGLFHYGFKTFSFSLFSVIRREIVNIFEFIQDEIFQFPSYFNISVYFNFIFE